MAHAIKRLSTFRPKGPHADRNVVIPTRLSRTVSDSAKKTFALLGLPSTCRTKPIAFSSVLDISTASTVNSNGNGNMPKLPMSPTKSGPMAAKANGTNAASTRCGTDARYPDGRTDGYSFIPDGHQHLCYNESDDKINWMYLRLTVDLATREYVELQSGTQIFNPARDQANLVQTIRRHPGFIEPSSLGRDRHEPTRFSLHRFHRRLLRIVLIRCLRTSVFNDTLAKGGVKNQTNDFGLMLTPSVLITHARKDSRVTKPEKTRTKSNNNETFHNSRP